MITGAAFGKRVVQSARLLGEKNITTIIETKTRNQLHVPKQQTPVSGSVGLVWFCFALDWLNTVFPHSCEAWYQFPLRLIILMGFCF